MSDIFLKIVNLSLSGAWVVAVVIVLRFLLKKAPKWIHVVLWGLVAFRLMCPFTIESKYSQMPEQVSSGRIVYEWTDHYVEDCEIIHESQPEFEEAIAAGLEPVSTDKGEIYVIAAADKVSAPKTVGNTVVPVLSGIWLTGMAGMLLYAAVSYWKLRRSVSQAVRHCSDIYLADRVVSPFVLGIFRPKIYLPFGLLMQDMGHVIAHERAHIHRKDHWWKPLGFLLLSVHWFNPVMWLAYSLLCRDIELACDQRVIRELGMELRADYSQALLNCSVHRRMILACPLAFGEVGVKERVKNVLNYKKPRLWITVLAVIAIAISSVLFLTAAAEEEIPEVAQSPLFDKTLLDADDISYDDLQLTVDEVTPSGLHLHCRIKDFDESEYAIYMISGAPYTIEKQTENGWEKLAVKMQNIRWNAVTILTGGEHDWWVQWSSVYGLLDEGNYRITTEVIEGMETVTAEFQITGSGVNAEDQALEKCNAALQELLDRDSYHILNSFVQTGGDNSTNYSEWWKSGEDFLELFSRTEGEVCDGKMKKDGVTYRLDNEEEGDTTTPVAGWSVWPDLSDTRASEWASGYVFSAQQADFSGEAAVISGEQITFRVIDTEPADEKTVTYQFDEQGKLSLIRIDCKVSNYNGNGSEMSYIYQLDILDDDAAAIAQKIDEQDVNFYREFSWAEDQQSNKAFDVGFHNTTAQPVTNAPEAIARAEAECSVEYTKIVVYRDEAAGMWKVEYQIMYGYQGYQYIYMDDDGITRMISGSGSKVEEWKEFYPDP